MSKFNPKPRILLQVSASIAAFKAVALCSKLVQSNFEVEVVLSRDAAYFIGPASFEGLTGKRVHQGNFEEGSMMAHIKLERWADLILVYPASANTIAQLANGLSQSLIGSLFLAHEFKKPYWIVPAMNQAMMKHPATLENLSKLQSWGLEVLRSDSGPLACGEEGSGRLIEPEVMLSQMLNYFAKNPVDTEHREAAPPNSGKKILITAGGTTEKIDSVRRLSNVSTGQTGYQLAKTLQALGNEVTLLQSEHSPFRSDFSPVLLFDTTADLSEKLKILLEDSHYDVLIHAAAVADYHVESVMSAEGRTLSTAAKIQSDEPLLLKLVPNPKILRSVRGWSQNKEMKLVSFKLTSGEASLLKLETYDSDLIVHNELSQVKGAAHRGAFYAQDQKSKKYQKRSEFHTKTELGSLLQDWIQDQFKDEELAK